MGDHEDVENDEDTEFQNHQCAKNFGRQFRRSVSHDADEYEAHDAEDVPGHCHPKAGQYQCSEVAESSHQATRQRYVCEHRDVRGGNASGLAESAGDVCVKRTSVYDASTHRGIADAEAHQDERCDEECSW